MEASLQARISSLEAELDKMSPNLKSRDKLDDTLARFKQVDAEFEEARVTVKEARDKFNAVKAKRCTLFNRAYQHISDRIDPVYKDLTKGTAAPLGGVAYLSLEDSEVSAISQLNVRVWPR